MGSTAVDVGFLAALHLGQHVDDHLLIVERAQRGAQPDGLESSGLVGHLVTDFRAVANLVDNSSVAIFGRIPKREAALAAGSALRRGKSEAGREIWLDVVALVDRYLRG